MNKKLFQLLLSVAVLLGAGSAMADHSKGNVDELRFGDAVDASGAGRTKL